VIHAERPAPAAPRHDHDARAGVVIVRGKRVSLRTLAPSDLASLSDWAEDPFIERMVGSEFLRTYRHVYDKGPAFYEAVVTDESQVAFIVEANQGFPHPVGLVRLFNIHLLEGYAFLETIITDVRALKKGFGVEAARLICCYGVDVLSLRRYEAKVYAYNVLSMNSLKKNGFRQEGVLRGAGYQDGEYCDVVVFGLVGAEVDAERARSELEYPGVV
jgi:RimJ/RimL family protein N-acetyltransferase